MKGALAMIHWIFIFYMEIVLLQFTSEKINPHRQWLCSFVTRADGRHGNLKIDSARVFNFNRAITFELQIEVQLTDTPSFAIFDEMSNQFKMSVQFQYF